MGSVTGLTPLAIRCHAGLISLSSAIRVALYSIMRGADRSAIARSLTRAIEALQGRELAMGIDLSARFGPPSRPRLGRPVHAGDLTSNAMLYQRYISYCRLVAALPGMLELCRCCPSRFLLNFLRKFAQRLYLRASGFRVGGAW